LSGAGVAFAMLYVQHLFSGAVVTHQLGGSRQIVLIAASSSFDFHKVKDLVRFRSPLNVGPLWRLGIDSTVSCDPNAQQSEGAIHQGIAGTPNGTAW